MCSVMLVWLKASMAGLGRADYRRLGWGFIVSQSAKRGAKGWMKDQQDQGDMLAQDVAAMLMTFQSGL